MSNEQNLPTCLVAIRAEIGDIFVEAERRLEHRVKQCEDLFGSLGWETEQVRSNLKQADKEVVRLYEMNQELQHQESEAQLQLTRENVKLNQANDEIRNLRTELEDKCAVICNRNEQILSMLTPEQCSAQVNKVHDELIEKLSAERKELELTQRLLQQARDERDDARLERKVAEKKCHGLQNLNRAQGERIAVMTQSLDILADMVKEQQRKAEEAEARRMQTEDDFGKLVGELDSGDTPDDDDPHCVVWSFPNKAEAQRFAVNAEYINAHNLDLAAASVFLDSTKALGAGTETRLALTAISEGLKTQLKLNNAMTLLERACNGDAVLIAKIRKLVNTIT